jgi:hypothetical protein
MKNMNGAGEREYSCCLLIFCSPMCFRFKGFDG